MAQRVPQNEQKKIFNDPVHGTMIFGPKLVEVIDTPQFQRLRNIKQLGTVYHVYPGATHSRFEHSLGTAHLAGKFIRMLQQNTSNPEIKITNDDVLCVEMAGLCHDLGHGPFSHMFDQLFLPAVGVDWQHEKGSCDMFSHLLKENNIKLSQDPEQHEKLEKRVKMMIKPPKDVKDIPKKKRFLYEFISNERNKVDVDKWDYFARDGHYLGIRNSFDYERSMILCRVIQLDNGVTTICSHEKESKNLYEMFHVRAALHKRAYQHRISTAVNLMLCDALVKANDQILIGTSKMSKVVENMEDYTDFDDNIIERIMQSTAPCLQESQSILRRIKVRKFYKFVGSTKLSIEEHTKLKKQHKENIDLGIAGEIWDLKEEPLNGEKEEILGVNVAKFDYGMKRDNPCESFYFYTKENPDKASQISRDDVSEMLPQVFVEYEIQVFCKTEDEESYSNIKKAFGKWQTALHT